MMGGPGLLLLPLLVGLGSAVSELPKNLRVDAVNKIYILKWDWDYQQNPHVTFSVKSSYSSLSNWRTMEGCENITRLECNVSKINILFGYKFLVLVYNNQTDEHNSSIVTFSPWDKTTIGPPTNMKLIMKNNDLHITVEAPEGLKDDYIWSYCTWMYHLEIWKNSTPEEVNTMKEIGPHFMLKAVEASTTYCARAYTKCTDRNRTGLYSESKCTDTEPMSYVKGWIIGAVFGGIIIILYICLCPFKRYLKYIIFPKSKLPSSIEKVLDNFPLLMYILAAKTLLLCLAFAGVKIYQSKRIEAKMKREQEEKRKRLVEEAEKEEMDKKDD